EEGGVAAPAHRGVHGATRTRGPSADGGGQDRQVIGRGVGIHGRQQDKRKRRSRLIPGCDRRIDDPATGGEGGSAGLTGLEPATSGVTDRRSNQLSYNPVRSSAGI